MKKFYNKYSRKDIAYIDSVPLKLELKDTKKRKIIKIG